MKYFELVQDCRILKYNYTIESFSLEEVEEENGDKEDIGMVSFKGKKEELPDFILYKNNLLVSDELKKIMEMYSDDLNFTLVMFNNVPDEEQKVYYNIQVPLIYGLSENSTYYKDNTVDKKIIKHEKVRDYPVFRLKEVETTQFSAKHIFVNLDIVESILRRNLWGMIFEEVMVEE